MTVTQLLVIVIIATCNRADALRTAILSVLAQTQSSWQLLVVGDDCDAASAELVAEFDDPRIRYINLQQRFGEQPVFSSVAVCLVRSPWIALPNPDRVMLC